MRLGLKRIFSRRKSRAEKIARSPKEKETPDTPPTQPVKEDVGEGRDDGSQAYSVELPVKNLLDDLNISEDNGRGDTELVLKLTDVPDDEPPMEPPYFGQGSERLDSEQEEDDAEAEKDTKTEELESHEEQAEKTTEAGKSKEPGESSSTVQFEDSPLRPRQLEPSGDLEIASDDGSLTEPAADQLVEKQVVRGASKDEQDATADMTKQVSRTLFGFYEKAKECASGVLHPEPSVRELVVPTADNALCQPIGRTRTRSGLSANRPRLLRQYSYYDEQFALKILDVSSVR